MRPDDWTEDEERLVAPLQQDLDAVRARHHGDPPLTLLRAADADALPEPLQADVAGELARHPWHRALLEGAAEAETGLDRAGEDRLLARIHAAGGVERAGTRASLPSNVAAGAGPRGRSRARDGRGPAHARAAIAGQYRHQRRERPPHRRRPPRRRLS